MIEYSCFITVGKSQREELEASGHIAAIVKEQMKVYTQLTSSISHCSESQPRSMVPPTVDGSSLLNLLNKDDPSESC